MSSAYKNKSHLTVIGISLTYIKNNKGPRIDPCDMPHDILENSEKGFSKFTINFRFDRGLKPFNSVIRKTNNA